MKNAKDTRIAETNKTRTKERKTTDYGKSKRLQQAPQIKNKKH
jgi:hypothetical protein